MSCDGFPLDFKNSSASGPPQHQKVEDPCWLTPHYLIKATSWQSGMNAGNDNSNLDHQCPPVGQGPYTSDYGSNSSHQSTSETMVKFSGAFTAFGVSFGAQSGWGTYVISHWNFGSTANHYLCGSNGSVAQAERVYAGVP